MKNFVYIYYNKGGIGDAPMEEVKKAWEAWFGQLGDKLVDGGNPFGDKPKAVSQDGVMDVKDMPATGYSIVKAASMDEAVEMAKGCPVIDAPGAVCVYETSPM